MKRLIRIAPFLILLALGIELLPRVQAAEITSQNFQEPTKKRIESNFHGVIILPNYTEQLLYSESMIPSETFEPEKVLYSKVDQPSKKQRSEINCDSTAENEDQLYFSTSDNNIKCCGSPATIKQ